MYKRIISSAGLIGAALFATSVSAQDMPPTPQAPTSQSPTTTQPDTPMPGQPQPPTTTTPSPAPGSAASVKVSDMIYGSDGNPVGTIESVQGGNAVLSTGAVKVQIPVSSIAQGPKGATIGLTKVQVEAQAQQRQAQQSTPPQ